MVYQVINRSNLSQLLWQANISEDTKGTNHNGKETDKLDLIKIKNLCSSKDAIKIVKMLATEKGKNL